jgi:cholesterol transport system auxiliary component
VSLRRTALPVALAALISGCVSIGEKAELTVYAPVIDIVANEAWPRIERTLAISEPNASRMLDSNRIAVRPSPSTLQVYGGAVWSDSAPALVQAALINAFAQGEHFRAVVRPTDSVSADLQLRLDLRHFEAVYAEDVKQPTVVIELQATLLDQRAQRVIGSRRFRAEQPAEREKLEHVVPAFETALGEVTAAMMPWVLETAAPD